MLKIPTRDVVIRFKAIKICPSPMQARKYVHTYVCVCAWTVPKVGRTAWRMCMAADSVIEWKWQTELLVLFISLLICCGAVFSKYQWSPWKWATRSPMHFRVTEEPCCQKIKIKASQFCDECCKSYRLISEAGRRSGRFGRPDPFPKDYRLIETSQDFNLLFAFRRAGRRRGYFQKMFIWPFRDIN
jgi:hypothetical protein